MKILHFSDAHLKDKDIEEAEKCLSFLTETARSEKVDLIINAGDTFDSQEVKLDSKSARLAIRVVSELADIAPVAIIIGTNSHDGKSPEILQFAKGRFPVHVASMPEQIMLSNDVFIVDAEAAKAQSGPGAIITLIPQPTKQFFQTDSGIAESDQEIGNAMSGLFAGFGVQAEGFDCPHILVGHFNVAGSELSNGQVRTGMDIEVSIEQIDFARPDLVCLGHIHKSQRLGHHTYYSGSLYHQNWGELETKGFYIYEFIDEELTGCKFFETPAKKLTRFSYDFTEYDVKPLPCEAEGVKGTYVRLDYKVWQDEAGTIDKDAITQELLAAGALDVDIRIVRVPRQNVRSEAVLKSDTLRDKIQKMAELKEEEVEWTILLKAELLENTLPDELVETVGGAA